MPGGTSRENTERVSAAPVTSARTGGPPAARPARQAGKATGAWADGDRAPLNHNEEFKQADDGLNVRAADHRRLRQERLRRHPR